MSKDLENLHHMLGIGAHIKRRQWGYRNHYAPGADDIESMERLVKYGLAVRGRAYNNMHYYHATLAGCIVAGLSVAKSLKIGVST